jgi:uncharacterized hydrophobic protein (TIGR00271 family)
MTKPLQQFFKQLLDLREGAEEKRTIIENIKDDSDFSSARFWVLVFAIGACSVGLNINSIPVIIGAMLISPLMGPIVSMGMSLAIYDWGLMRRSFKNLLLLTAISILISTIYFALSPISNAQSELLARTSPTIFDVLIAIFGGLAGFIGLSRAKHNNIIPGVAIATAIMPPLCTVGYGIATLQPTFIYGAFYLFLINCIFICLSALVVARYLKLPKREYPDAAHKKRVNRFITAIIVVIISPAIYLAYTFVGQTNFNQNADQFISRVFEDMGYVVIHREISYSRTDSSIEIAFLTERFSNQQIDAFAARLPDFGLVNTKLDIRQNSFALTEDEWIAALNEIRGDDDKVAALEARLEAEQQSFESPTRLLNEAKAINSIVQNIAVGNIEYGTDVTAEESQTIALLYTDTSQNPLTAAEADGFKLWLQTRLDTNKLLLIVSPQPTTSTTATASTTAE